MSLWLHGWHSPHSLFPARAASWTSCPDGHSRWKSALDGESFRVFSRSKPAPGPRDEAEGLTVRGTSRRQRHRSTDAGGRLKTEAYQQRGDCRLCKSLCLASSFLRVRTRHWSGGAGHPRGSVLSSIACARTFVASPAKERAYAVVLPRWGGRSSCRALSRGCPRGRD
jgi:hypothetical protein